MAIDTLRSIQQDVERVAITMYDREESASHLGKIATITPAPPAFVAGQTFVLEWAWIHPILRKWIGERQIQGVSGESLTFTWDRYEITMQTDRDAVGSGQARVKVEDTTPKIMTAFSQGKFFLAVDVVRNGETVQTYDATALYSATHKGPNGVADKSNLITVPARADNALPTVAEARAELIAAQQRLLVNRIFNDTVVSAAEIDKSIVIVTRSAGVYSAFNTLRTEETIDLASNRFRGTFELLLDTAPVSGTENSWDIIFQDPGGWRPVILVPVREPAGIEFDTTQEFSHGVINYGAYGKYAAKAAWWQTTVRSKP